MTTLGYVVLTRHPAPRTEHGWTYTALSAIFPTLTQAQNVYESRRTQGDYVIAEITAYTTEKPPWPDLSEPVQQPAVDLDAIHERLPLTRARPRRRPKT